MKNASSETSSNSSKIEVHNLSIENDIENQISIIKQTYKRIYIRNIISCIFY